jgi:DNA-binding transcriptional LysR family regulator
VGSVPIGLFAHKRYLERHGSPASLDDAIGQVIGYDRSTMLLAALEALQLPISREMFSFRCDSDMAQIAALRAGFGIGGCQLGIARRDPNLVPVLQNEFRFELEVWVAMHEDLKSIKRMRLMFDWLFEGMRAYVAESRVD